MPKKPQAQQSPKARASNAPAKRPKLKPRKKLTEKEREVNGLLNTFMMAGMMAVLARALCRMPFGKIQPTGGDFELPKLTAKTSNPAHKPGRRRSRSVKNSRKRAPKPSTGSKEK